MRNAIVDRDTFMLGWPPKDTYASNGTWFGVHVDAPWSEDVRLFDAPRRLYVHLGPFGCVEVALGRDSKMQPWTFKTGWHNELTTWRWATWSPPRWAMCDHTVLETPARGLGMTALRTTRCGRMRRHRGPHAVPIWR